MLIFDFFLFVDPLPWKPISIFFARKSSKINEKGGGGVCF